MTREDLPEVLLLVLAVALGVFLGHWVARKTIEPKVIQSPPEIRVIEVPSICEPRIVHVPTESGTKFSSCFDIGNGMTHCTEWQ